MPPGRDDPPEPDRGRAAELARRHAEEGRAVQRRGPEVHRPGEMGFEPGLSRDELWMTLPQSVRDRMWQYSGPEVLVWWAQGEEGGRPVARMLGERGLCFADPRVNTEHRPVYELAVYQLDPGSLRRVDVDHRPGPNERPELPLNAAPRGGRSPGPPDGRPVTTPLQPQLRNVLGHLPPRVQELLQVPFAAGQEVLRQDNYYYGTQGGDLDAFCMVLAGPRDVTAVDGTRVIPVGHTEQTAHWDLRVYRASVVRRMGR